MTMKFIVDKSGTINFPYIGVLGLKDKTPEQVNIELTQRLRNGYMVNPMVTVSLAEFRKFYVSGEVKSPNGFAWEPGLTVEKAIAQAGDLLTVQIAKISTFASPVVISYLRMLI